MSVDRPIDQDDDSDQHRNTEPVSRPVVRILGRGDGVVVQIRDVANAWSQVVEMLTNHLTQANGFFRGERIFLDLGDYHVSHAELRSLLEVLRDQEVSLRTLRTTNEDVYHLAQEMGLEVTLQIQSQSGQTGAAESLPAPNWEVFLGDKGQDDAAGTGSEAHQQANRLAAKGSQSSAHPVDLDDADILVGPAVQSSVIENESSPDLLQRISAPPYFYRGTLRSGQVLRHAGPIVVVGDVNPGAQVISGGDVYIWGRLRGVVHAGAIGNERSMVGALDFEPIQLRIASHIAMSPKGDENDPARYFWKRSAVGRPEVARVIQGRIVVDQWDARLG